MAPRFPVAHAALLLCLLAVAGCGNSKPNPTDPSYFGNQGPGQNTGGSISDDDSLFHFGTAKDGANSTGGPGSGLGVNAYLWRGALDTLSFMPLASADPFGGVIITDWYSPPTTADERFKATAYILGRQLRSDGVRVSIFRQVRDGGQWTDAPVNPATASEIESKVLARARELRAQSAKG